MEPDLLSELLLLVIAAVMSFFLILTGITERTRSGGVIKSRGIREAA